MTIFIVLIVIAGIGAAVYYFMFMKKKGAGRSGPADSSDLDMSSGDSMPSKDDSMVGDMKDSMGGSESDDSMPDENKQQ